MDKVTNKPIELTIINEAIDASDNVDAKDSHLHNAIDNLASKLHDDSIKYEDGKMSLHKYHHEIRQYLGDLEALELTAKNHHSKHAIHQAMKAIEGAFDGETNLNVHAAAITNVRTDLLLLLQKDGYGANGADDSGEAFQAFLKALEDADPQNHTHVNFQIKNEVIAIDKGGDEKVVGHADDVHLHKELKDAGATDAQIHHIMHEVSGSSGNPPKKEVGQVGDFHISHGAVTYSTGSDAQGESLGTLSDPDALKQSLQDHGATHHQIKTLLNDYKMH